MWPASMILVRFFAPAAAALVLLYYLLVCSVLLHTFGFIGAPRWAVQLWFGLWGAYFGGMFFVLSDERIAPLVKEMNKATGRR